jgi:hypothetical protein
MGQNSEDPSPDHPRESTSKLLSDWRELLSRLTEEAETFTREKPAMGLAAAFFAGVFVSSFFRRR